MAADRYSETPYDVDFAIVTIISKALEATRRIFGISDQPVRGPSGRLYYSGDVPTTSRGGHMSTVVLVKDIFQSNIAHTNLIRDVLEDFNPKFLLVIDIGGGISGRQGQRLGDVAVSDNFKYYEHQKWVGRREVDRDLVLEPPSPSLLTIVDTIGDDWARSVASIRPVGKITLSKVVRGLILTGDKLQGDAHRKRLRDLLKRHENAIAFDMESAGLAYAIYDLRLRGKHIEYLVIRGISDYVNRKKNQRTRNLWRPYAAEAAVALGLGLVQNAFPPKIEPREIPDPRANVDVPRTTYGKRMLFRIGALETECIHYFGTGAKEDSWDQKSVQTYFVNQNWKPPYDILSVQPWFVKQFEKEKAEQGTPAGFIRFLDYFRTNKIWTEETPSGRRELRITYKRVNYRDIIATHIYQDVPLKDQDQPQTAWTIRSRYARPEDVCDSQLMPKFRLANHGAVALTVITGDDKFLFPSRTAGTEGRPGYGCVGESMLYRRDQRIENGRVIPDPFLAAINGAKEELALEMKPASVKLSAVFFDTDFSQVILGAISHTSRTSKDILGRLSEARDLWEIRQTADGRDVMVVDNDPRNVRRVFQKLQWTTWGKTAGAFSLIHEHGREKVEAAFA